MADASQDPLADFLAGLPEDPPVISRLRDTILSVDAVDEGARQRVVQEALKTAKPLSMGTRAKLSFKNDNQGAIRWLQETEGAENVLPFDNGENALIIRGDEVFVKDKPGFLGDVGGDLADLTADAAEVAVPIAAGVGAALTGGAPGALTAIGRSIAGQAGGAALSSTARSAISEALPGEDPNASAWERVSQAGTRAAVAGVLGGVTGAVGQAGGKARPLIGQMLRKGRKEVTAVGEESAKLAQRTISATEDLSTTTATGRVLGLTLDPAQAGQGQQMRQYISQLKTRTPIVFKEAEERNLKVLADNVDNVLRSIGPKTPEGQAAKAVQVSTAEMLDGMRKKGQEALSPLWDEAFAATGGEKVVLGTNYLDALDLLSKDSPVGQGTLNRLKEQFRSGMTVKDLQTELAKWGAAAYKGKKVVPALDKENTIAFGQFLTRALRSDLDTLVSQKGVSGQAGKTLQDVRKGYAELSTFLENQRQDVLEKTLRSMLPNRFKGTQFGAEDLLNGKSLVTALSKRFDATDIRKTLTAINQWAPKDVAALRRAAVEDILGGFDDTMTVNPFTMSQTINKNWERLSALIPEGADSPQMKILGALAEAGRAMKSTASDSPGNLLAQQQNWLGIAGNILREGTRGVPKTPGDTPSLLNRALNSMTGIPQEILKQSFPETFAKILTDPKLARMMFGLMKVPTKRTAQGRSILAGNILAQMSKQDLSDEVYQGLKQELTELRKSDAQTRSLVEHERSGLPKARR